MSLRNRALLIEQTAMMRSVIKADIPGNKSMVLAGGAVRDLLHDKPISDLDFILSVPDNLSPWSAEAAEQYGRNIRMNLIDRTSGPWGLEIKGSGDVLDEYRIPGLVGVITLKPLLTTTKYYPTDLIFVERPERHLTGWIYNQFDFGICMVGLQISMDDNEPPKLWRSDRFYQDSQRKQLTLYTDNLCGEHTEAHVMSKHFPKIKQKYANYGLNVMRKPEVYRHKP